MKIFTLIQYRWGGDNHPSDRGQDISESDLSISSWDDSRASEVDTWASYIANCWVDQQYKGTYDFDRFTLLIDGVHVSSTASEDIYDFRTIPSREDGSATLEEIAHEQYVEDFWVKVVEYKNQLVEEYNEELAAEKARKAEALRIHNAEIAKGTEVHERVLYEALKRKFEGN